MDARARFLTSLGLLMGVLLIGTFGYVTIEKVGLLDAAYMTVVTVSTVGFREVVSPSSDASRLFTMIIIMVGVGSVSFSSVSLITLFVSGELHTAMDDSKHQKRIHRMHGHTIVCGYGRMGHLIAKQLSERGVTALVIDLNPDQIALARKRGLVCVQGDACEESTLAQARLTEATTLVATLPRDSDNVYVALTARGMHPTLNIIARAEIAATEEKLLRAGANRVVCPQVIGASRISSLVTRPNVVDFVDVAAQDTEFEIDEYRIAEGSVLVGKSLRDSMFRQQVDAIIVSIKRADGVSIFNPPADHVMEAGDTLILVGHINMATRLAQL